jgi:hypothetical protein
MFLKLNVRQQSSTSANLRVNLKNIKLLERKIVVIWSHIGSHKLCTKRSDYVYVKKGYYIS